MTKRLLLGCKVYKKLIKRLQKIKRLSKRYQKVIKAVSKGYQSGIKRLSKRYQKVIKAVSIEIPRIKPPQIRFKRLFQN